MPGPSEGGTRSNLAPRSFSGGRQVVQGSFRSRTFLSATIHPAHMAKAAQPKTTIHRPGLEAFPVDLRPKSGGWPLPRDVQAKMEAALGANFSDVRVHVGPEAAAIGAIAFTWGSELHFAPGQYNPHTPHGQFLLGHELAHVVQQRAGRVANPFGSGVAVVQDQLLEAEADSLGRMAAMRSSVTSNFGLQKNPSDRAGASTVINRKSDAPVQYALRAPLPNGSGWLIEVAPQGSTQTIGSVQLTASRDGVSISNLKVIAEHRRQGVAGQLIHAALRTARSNGYGVAQLEACPDTAADISQAGLVSIYRKLGFIAKGVSPRGNPVMEHKI